ncbi:cytochrome b/b6 domain-containing protein [Sphingomonas sp. UNC305MFCol5.2]|uniref:cytochrome b/b6 domain-containing protein n=1 Tax=Sphingomonas sp. UNC305MFCol5.2 TaxID=1449076 RepID=UPI0004A6CA39|nr:cytochrome b/b6 domain-containing protein [Sphingomonas sp. UNC305MFCol5.2]
MNANRAPLLRRWDPLVRIAHWGTVAAVIANALVTEEGSAAHVWVGFGLASLLALRLLWGFVGTPQARFSAFPPSPSRALAHIRDIAAGRHTIHASHNPLGALMVYTMWSCLAVIVATGIALSPPSGLSGNAISGRESQAEPMERLSATKVSTRHDGRGEHEDEEGTLTEAHEIAVNLLYVLIALHLAGVIFETRRAGPQIIGAMLPWPPRRRRE